MDEERYWGDVLQSFQNGVQLDLRVKLAIEFLKSPGAMGVGTSPKEDATYALDLAAELLNSAHERGWTKPLPEDDGVPKAMRQHIRRSIRTQVIQQRYGQEISAEEANPLAPPPVSIVPRRQ